MNLSKLRRQHVLILGPTICVMIAVGLYFLLIKPVDEQIKQVDSQLQASQAVAARLGSAQSGLADALLQVSRTQSTLARYENTKMPNLSFAQRDRGMIQLWHEQVENLGPILANWASRSGVKLMSEFSIPAPPTNPNSIDTSMIKIPVGTMTVTGDFQSLMSHIRSWNACPRLVQIDRPTLTGMSPALTASYELTVYVFPRGETGPQIQIAGGGGEGGGAVSMPGAPMAPPPAGVTSGSPGSAPASAGAGTERYGVRGT